jgi:hypothetical protein
MNGQSGNGRTEAERLVKKKLIGSALKSKPKFSLPGFLGALLNEAKGEEGLARMWAETYAAAEPGGNTRRALVEMAMKAMIQAHASIPTEEVAVEDLEAEAERLLAD